MGGKQSESGFPVPAGEPSDRSDHTPINRNEYDERSAEKRLRDLNSYGDDVIPEEFASPS